jgi:ABC-type glycerol-3-phosphate transport system substrate-binding protein
MVFRKSAIFVRASRSISLFRMCDRGLFSRLTGFVSICVVLSILLASCTDAQTNRFPFVTQPQQGTTAPTMSEDTSQTTIDPNEQEPVVLKVAAPISSSTAEYLARLYVAKQDNSLDIGVNGSNISLDALDQYQVPFTVEILQTPSSGVTVDTIEQWKEKDFIPDILFTDAQYLLHDSGDILPLSNLVASNSLYLPTNINPSMLESCTMDDQLYGIPYTSAAQILYLNMDVLKEAGVERVPFQMDLDMFLNISQTVRDSTSKETPLDERNIAFYLASELLPFLPSSFSAESGWFMFGGTSFDFNSSAFSDTVMFLRSYVDDGYSIESLSSDDKISAFASEDPRLSNQVAMWVGSTQEISFWTTNTSYELSIVQIPSNTGVLNSPPALTVYPLCISSSTQYAQLACDFASFMALDTDAILLTARLEQSEGYLPVVLSGTVWNDVMEQQIFGAEMLQIKQSIDSAYYNPMTNHEPDYRLINDILTKYSEMLLDTETDLETTISLLSNERLTT